MLIDSTPNSRLRVLWRQQLRPALLQQPQLLQRERQRMRLRCLRALQLWPALTVP